MNIEGFRNWMKNNRVSKRVACNNISRAKRIERELGIDFDLEYERDKCEHLLKCFANKGINNEMKAYRSMLPIGRDCMEPYGTAIRKYIAYKSD